MNTRTERLQSSLLALEEAGVLQVRRWEAEEAVAQDLPPLVAHRQLAVVERAATCGHELSHVFEDDMFSSRSGPPIPRHF